MSVEDNASLFSFVSAFPIDKVVQQGEVTIVNDGDTRETFHGTYQKAKVVSYSEPYVPTGATVDGDTATGTVTIINEEEGVSGTTPTTLFVLPSGTILTSTGGLKFRTTQDAAVPEALFTVSGGVATLDTPGEVTVTATAVAAGSAYNLSAGSHLDIADIYPSGIYGEINSMTGGTGDRPNFRKALARARWSIDGGTNWQALEAQLIYSFQITNTGGPSNPTLKGLDSAISIGVDQSTVFFRTANGRHGNYNFSTGAYTPTSRTFKIQYVLYEVD